MRTFARIVVGAACLALLPAIASAQTSGINGQVKDTSGAVLPGVTVEAASPALIERVRSAVTDGSGQYKITTSGPAPTRSPSPCPASALSSATTSS